MKLYGVEIELKNGKLQCGKYDGITTYPMRWRKHHRQWEYCIGQYSPGYYRKLIKQKQARFDFLGFN